LLPLGGLMMALFAGYAMRKNHVEEELRLKPASFKLWRIANNFIAPIAILGIFVFMFGLIK
jgi:NSS family neurotransmitter:Na+ symporter